MSQGIMPPPGRYRLSYEPGMSLTVNVDDMGLNSALGRFSWIDPPGFFLRGTVEPQVVIRFIDATTYVALVGVEGYAGEYHPA